MSSDVQPLPLALPSAEQSSDAIVNAALNISRGAAMPHYFFHLRTTDGIERDDEGITFPSLDRARADALACLFQMASDELSAGRQTNLLGIDITDGQRTVLASVKMWDPVSAPPSSEPGAAR